MGAFDDLIPRKGGGAFSDLLPQPKRRQRSAAEEVAGFMANVNRGLGIGDELAAGVRTAAGAIDDGLKGRRGPGLRQRFEQAMASQRDVEDTYAADRPKLAALGRGVGMAGTAAGPGAPAVGALANSTRIGNMARGATAAALSGAAYAGADRGSARERLASASRAAVDPLTIALGAASGAAAPAARANRKPKVNPDVRTLREAGIPVTPGQAGGPIRRGMEEAATSLPFAGDSIIAAQKRGVEAYNRKHMEDALGAIDEMLPENIATGSDAIKYTGDRLSAAYDNLVPEGMVTADDEFARGVADRLGDLATDMTPGDKSRLNTILQNRVVSRLQNGSSASTYQKMISGLKTAAGKFSKDRDVDKQAIGEGIEIVIDEIQALAARQNPAYAAQKAKIDKGWAQLATAETAAARAGSEGGMYSPKGYMGAVRAGDNSVRRRRVARGEAPGQELAGAAERVLSNKTPDSGTPRRLLQAGGGLAAVGGASINLPATAAAGAGVGATMAAYSRKGIELYNRALDRKIAAADRKMAVDALKELARQSPEAAKLYDELVRRIPGGLGVAANAPEEGALARYRPAA